jgi:hypothetical protein
MQPSSIGPRYTFIRPGVGLLLVASLALWIAACDATTLEPAVLNGVVTNAETDEPVAGALVQLFDSARTRIFAETTSDAGGQFSFTIDLDSTATFRVAASISGFQAAERTVTLRAEEVFTLSAPLALAPLDNGGPGGPGEPTEPREARSITLADRTSQTIGVSGSGSVETSTLTFAVLDGRGEPLDEISSVLVRFRLLNQPSIPGSAGAEFLFPDEAMSDEDGQASVTLTSGTTSGPVQVQAEIETPAGIIRSTPVVITIHGGLPDQDHFTVAPVQRNFHARTIYGIENVITVIVGDQYGNPVQPNTSIFFTTTHGVVEGSGATDALGRASAILQSADPLPNIDGLGTITARTVGIGGSSVSKTTLVLFSGPTVVELEFVGGDLDNGGEEYIYRVTDDLGNPIVGGSTVSVTVEGEEIRTIGDTAVTIPDSRVPGEGITEFRFLVRKAASDSENPSIDNIVIQVTSLNGNRTYSYFMRPAGAVGILTPAEVIEN